jgi:hypothetical protein
MLARSLLFALLALAFAAPSAGAATLGDLFVPDYDASDGVTVRTTSHHREFIHFGPEAAQLYRTIAGKRAMVGCGEVTPRKLDDVFFTTGFASSTVTLSRKRAGVSLMDSSGTPELCMIATKLASGGPCLPLSSPDEKWCARVIVAVSDSGRAFLDRKKRAIELFTVPTYEELAKDENGARLKPLLDRYVVALPDPDAAPPAGKVGYWTQGEDIVCSSLLADGKRAFLSMRAGVYSTNLDDLMGPPEDAFTIF